MKRMHKFASLLLAAAMAVTSLAGCGSQEEAAAEPESAQEPAEEQAAVDPDNPWMIGDPDNPIELTVFLNHTWYDTESFTGIIPEEITRRT